MDNGRKLIFKEKADEMPGPESTLLCAISNTSQAVSLATFKRAGAHLTMEHELSLREALFGYEFAFSHLDKRQVKLRHKGSELFN
eukprot:454839-Hanusia_phi.AAC.8